MAIETAVKIDVDVNGIQTVQQAATVYEDLGDAVAKTQREAEALALQFGINDKRTQEAIKVAGQYKKQLEELDFAVDANRGNTQKLFGAIQGVAAGFEVAAGAMALFGGESKELDKILVKVQGAMVFAQGLKDLKEFAPAIKSINSGFLNMIKTLKGVKLALAATGIGALVAVVGLFGDQIGKIFDSLKEKFKGFTDSIGLTNFAAEEAINKQQKLIDALNREMATMEARGDSEEALFQKRLEIAKQEEILANQKLALLKVGEEGYLEAEKTALDSSNNIVNIKEAENKRLKDLQDEKIKLEKEKEQERIDFLKEKSKNYADEAESFLNKTQRRRQKDLQDWYAQELQLVIGNFEAEGNLFDLYNKKRKQLQDDFAREDRERLDAQLNDVVSFFKIFGDLANTYAGENEERAKKSFQINKAVSIAEAVVNTYTGATAALATKTELYPYERFVRAALVISTGLAQIAQIQKTKYNSSNINTASSTVTKPFLGFQAPTTRLPQGQDILTQDRKVYVLEGDITRTQRRAATNQNVSVLGG